MYSLVALEKDDFLLTRDGNIKVRHPVFQGREGFVAFYTMWCPQCQDTKTSWSALGLVKGSWKLQGPQLDPYARDRMITRTRCIKRFPYIQAIRHDGLVIDYPGDPKLVIDLICKKAGLNCGMVHRCFSTQRYYYDL